MVFNAQRDAYIMWGNMENLYWDSSFTTLEGMLILNCPTEKVARVIKLQLKESALIQGRFLFPGGWKTSGICCTLCRQREIQGFIVVTDCIQRKPSYN